MFVPDSLQGREPVPAGLLHSPSIKHGRPQATKETENKESCRISSKNYVRKYYKFSFRFQKGRKSKFRQFKSKNTEVMFSVLS